MLVRRPAIPAAPDAATALVRFRGTGDYGISGHRSRDQSGLMLAARTTLPHFAVSSAINSSKAAGDKVVTVAPNWSKRSFAVGSARTALISLLSFSMISRGVFFG